MINHPLTKHEVNLILRALDSYADRDLCYGEMRETFGVIDKMNYALDLHESMYRV